MGWWRSRRNPESLLGDGPADALHLELERLAGELDARPTFQMLLDGFASALDSNADGLVADPDSVRGKPLVARFDPPASPLSSGSAPLDPRVRHDLASALSAITGAYELELSRKPTSAELLETIAFILRPDPAQYVSGIEGRRLMDISLDAGR